MIYATLLLSSYLLVLISIYQAGWFPYLVALFVVYLSLKLTKKYRQTTIPSDGKAVFISGCDSGFGHAIAIRLHEKGFRVFAGCLFPEENGAKTLVDKCGDNLIVVPLDVTKDESVKQAERIVRDNLQDTSLWGLVSNAGVHCFGDIELTSIQQYQRVFDVNVFGMLRLTKTFIPLLRKSKGRIVVTSSIAGFFRCPSVSGYGASKVALEALSDCLRMEMKKFGIKVSILQPSAFGGNTNITNGDNLTRLYTDADDAWCNNSDDVKKVYGRDYTKSSIDALISLKETFSCSRGVTPVVEAMEECIMSSDPEYRILIPGGQYRMDPVILMWSIVHFCPTFIRDWFLCKAMGHSDTSRIVVTSSIAGFFRCPSVSGYGASKVALEALSDCLRMEMKKFGIKVSILQPSAFGGNTNITNGDNLTRLYTDADDAWCNNSDDVKKVYGRDYTKSSIDALISLKETFSCSRGVTPVVEAMEECIMSSDPEYRILIPGGQYRMDPVILMWSIVHFCPTFIRDWFLCKAMGHSDTSKLQGINNPLFPESGRE